MNRNNSILEQMIQRDLQGVKSYELSDHQEENPKRIQVMRDEILYIHCISAETDSSFWIEYHSSTESRLFKKDLSELEQVHHLPVTRHKGSVYFSTSGMFPYQVGYVKLKIIA